MIASAGLMNPQIRFGEDLMSRVSYIMMNPGGDAETHRRRCAKHSTTLVGEVAAEAGISRTDVLEMTVVGNPIMHHLLLGLDPVELGGAPFALTIDGAYEAPARDFGHHHRARRLCLRPALHRRPCRRRHSRRRAIRGSVPEGRADAAGRRRHQRRDRAGQPANGCWPARRQPALPSRAPRSPADSALRRARSSASASIRATLEPRYKVIGCDLWSDEPGFAEATVSTGVTGICGSGIIEVIAEMWLAGIITQDGVVDGSMAARTPRVEATGRTFSYLIREGEPRLAITQNDVRAIQLAKAALYAGIKLLMDRYGVSKVERITLAGAFGSHIDVTYAMVLGLIPDCDLAKVASAGNAAGTGARIALLNARARSEIEQTVLRIEKIETALEPAFQEHFVSAMAIPNKTDAFPELSKVIDLSRSEGIRPGRRQRPSQAAARRLSAALPTSLRCNNPVNPSYFLR